MDYSGYPPPGTTVKIKVSTRYVRGAVSDPWFRAIMLPPGEEGAIACLLRPSDAKKINPRTCTYWSNRGYYVDKVELLPQEQLRELERIEAVKVILSEFRYMPGEADR